jgi:hypothetical protein
MPHVLRREVAIHDECPNKFVPSKQWVVGQMSAAKSGGMTYGWYLVFQSSGRLTPGCGHAGQNTAIEPSGLASSG